MIRLIIISLGVCCLFEVRAATVTVPTGSTVTAGGPFQDGTSPTGTTRYQEVFGHQPFDSLFPGGILITGLGFYSRTPGTNQRFTLSLELSTTARNPDGLSTTFADNTGADNLVVFESLTPIFVSTITDGQGRNVYAFPLQRPFTYLPQSGNLLLDIRNFDSFSTAVDAPFFEHVDASGDLVSRIYGQNVFGSFGAPRTDGLQVRFTYEPVPEPGTVALFILGAAGLAVLRLKRRQQR